MPVAPVLGTGANLGASHLELLIRRSGPEAGPPMIREDGTPAWQFRGACRGEDPALFFVPSHVERKEERDAREAKAKTICDRCVVRADCLEYAIATREAHGVWGGLNELERRALVRDLERNVG